MTEASRLFDDLLDAVQPSLVGDQTVVETFAVTLFARGHVLLGGWPGAATMTAATVFSRALGLAQGHVRLTPDAGRDDLLGTGVQEDGRRAGPVSSNLLLVDELDRAPARVQTTLVEAMDGGEVDHHGTRVDLPRPFMVIATLNPYEADAIYGIPTSYRDRFLFWLQLDDLDYEAGMDLLNRYDRDETFGAEGVEPVAGPETVLDVQAAVRDTYVDTSVKEHLLEVVLATQDHPDVERGASTWSAPTLLRAVKALAAIRGRDFVIPDDVQTIARPALSPRLVLTTEAELNDVGPADVVTDVLGSVVPPGTEFETDAPPSEAWKPE